MRFLKSIKLNGFLSFPPDSPAIELAPLNVLIGANGSGKSNLLEAISLLQALPTSIADPIREGGGTDEWLWKGEDERASASALVDVVVSGEAMIPDLRYSLAFASSKGRVEVIAEVIEEATVRAGEQSLLWYYRNLFGTPVIYVSETERASVEEPDMYPAQEPPPPPHPPGNSFAFPMYLNRNKVDPGESIISQRRDPEIYPELTWLSQRFSNLFSFRDWNFGRGTPLRLPQRADLPADRLLADASNLWLILNEITNSDAYTKLNDLLNRFLPRFKRFSTKIYGGSVQLFLHEDGLKSPIPASRLSDGTLRFMAMLAILLLPHPPPLICLEEPELGLHPDAVSLLADLLVDASKRSQLIVTTHSDALVSALSETADSVLVCEYQGGTQIERIDPDRLESWLVQYRLGEVWRIGELGGNP